VNLIAREDNNVTYLQTATYVLEYYLVTLDAQRELDNKGNIVVHK